MTSPRLAPPFWRHDAYTLGRLATEVRVAAQALLVDAGPSPTVVDLGAGEAPYRSLFEDHRARYVCCDIDLPAGSPGIRIEPGVPVPLADGCARLVVSFQVLEHVWDLDWYLGQARRLLDAQGSLLLSTHGTWLYHPHPTDFRRWTRTGLITELTERGFDVVSVRGLVGPLAWTTQFRALGWNRVLQSVPLLGPILAALSNSLHHLRMRLEDRITPAGWKDDNAAIYLVVARPAKAAAAGSA